MAKLVLSLGDKFLREIPLTKQSVTIGRRLDNDVVIDDLAISGEHAAIITANGDPVLEDLNSTNGTQVNGQPIKKHYLQDQDVIALARYRLQYFSRSDRRDHFPAESYSGAVAQVTVLDGIRAGLETALVKPLTTIGLPGKQVLVIVRRDDGFCISSLDGSECPTINGRQMEGDLHLLHSGDLIEFAGIRLRFSIP